MTLFTVYLNRWKGDRPENNGLCDVCIEPATVVEVDCGNAGCSPCICAPCLSEALAALNKAVLEGAAK